MVLHPRSFFLPVVILTIVFCYIISYADSTSFYFVQITDTHWGNGDNLKRTHEAIAAINNLPVPIEFVVHTGDITHHKIDNQKLVDSGLTIMRTCKFPIYYLPGNNDISDRHFIDEREAFTRNFGPISNRIDLKNISIVTLYNLEIKDSSGKFYNDPLSKLDSILKAKPATLPALVFQHCPTTEDFYSNKFHPGWPAEKLNEFRKICETYKVQAIICGHFHRDELHWIGKIPLFVAPPISGAWGRQSSFRVYHYENGNLDYFTNYF